MKDRIYKDLYLTLGTEILRAKHIKAIDVMQLLMDISEENPKTLSDIIRIIINQQQYDLLIGADE